MQVPVLGEIIFIPTISHRLTFEYHDSVFKRKVTPVLIITCEKLHPAESGARLQIIPGSWRATLTIVQILHVPFVSLSTFPTTQARRKLVLPPGLSILLHHRSPSDIRPSAVVHGHTLPFCPPQVVSFRINPYS